MTSLRIEAYLSLVGVVALRPRWDLVSHVALLNRIQSRDKRCAAVGRRLEAAPGQLSLTVVFGLRLPCAVVTKRPLIALR